MTTYSSGAAPAAANPLRALGAAGQSVWLDYLHRRILEDGELARLIEVDGVRGLTSNPAIFQKAIGESDAYDGVLSTLIAAGDAEVVDLYERLAVADIQAAADAFRALWDARGGRDGFVSLEVSPYLAHDTEGTLAEARRLWRQVDRPNLMIKVPGTPAGVPAIRVLIGEGINVNVTLLFGVEAYLAVAEAHLAGLEALRAAGGDVTAVHGVASFFVSRIDAMIDARIDGRLAGAAPAEAEALKALRGKVAIANAKAAYRHYQEMIAGPRWQALAAAGASPQRLLWASTGVKDPAYSDVLYVETLIGPDTVNTMPPATLDAFRDHGVARSTLADDFAGAERTLATAERLGLDLGGVTAHLATDGVIKFSQAFDELLGAVADKRAAILGGRLNRQAVFPGPLRAEHDAAIARAAAEGWTRRLWARDASLWSGGAAARWLGWLDAALGEAVDPIALATLSADVRSRGFDDALLLGMGGSSLGPEVLATTFGAAPGHPKLLVLDSTDPAQVARFAAEIDPARTLFVVASKSGSTLEPDVLHRYFFDLVAQAVGADAAGRQFIAITDPGSALEATATAQGFWRTFHGRPDIGGRYSVLSNFGMVPAAILGLDIGAIYESVTLMARACGASAPPRQNPGVSLGLLMGVAAKAGHDKLTLSAAPAVVDFGAWLEQLVAESTGKSGLGIIPIDADPLAPEAMDGSDRLMVGIAVAEGAAVAPGGPVGTPGVSVALGAPEDLFQEFLRWEIATAVAGAVMGIDPFDQPDVESSKIETRTLTDAYESTGSLPAQTPLLTDGPVRLFTDAANAAALAAPATLEDALAAQFGRSGPGDYLAILAYVDRSPAHIAQLGALRARLGRRFRLASVLQFGPRFLHSTGQAYKGGPNSGVFLQITTGAARDLPIPGRGLTFGVVEAAEARGDFEVLCARGRRALRIDLGEDVEAGLRRLTDACARAFP